MVVPVMLSLRSASPTATVPGVRPIGPRGEIRSVTYIVMFDRATKLPAVIRTRDEDFVYGDSNYDMILSDWKDVGGGLKRPHGLSLQLNGMEV
jgi:hypothetical protein